jgi:hypothetical protein
MTRNTEPMAAAPIGIWRSSALLNTGAAMVVTVAIVGGGCANAGCANALPATANANIVVRILIIDSYLNTVR